MPITPRPPKPAGGNSNYVDEVSAGFRDIIDADIDLDFNTIYGLVNGGLTDANIATAAAIAYSKLNLRGSINYSDLASTFTLPANQVTPGSGGATLPPSVIGDGSITWQKIRPTNSLVSAPSVASGVGPTSVLIPFANLVLQTQTLTVETAPASFGGRVLYAIGSVQVIYPTFIVTSVVNASLTAKIWAGAVGSGRTVAESSIQVFGGNRPGDPPGTVVSATLHLIGNDIAANGTVPYYLTLDGDGQSNVTVDWSTLAVFQPA